MKWNVHFENSFLFICIHCIILQASSTIATWKKTGKKKKATKTNKTDANHFQKRSSPFEFILRNQFHCCNTARSHIKRKNSFRNVDIFDADDDESNQHRVDQGWVNYWLFGQQPNTMSFILMRDEMTPFTRIHIQMHIQIMWLLNYIRTNAHTRIQTTTISSRTARERSFRLSTYLAISILAIHFFTRNIHNSIIAFNSNGFVCACAFSVSLSLFIAIHFHANGNK